MTQEKKVQTAAVMDVTGVERSAQDAVRAARQMAEGITREGEKAGKGLEAMGAGAERAGARKTCRPTGAKTAAPAPAADLGGRSAEPATGEAAILNAVQQWRATAALTANSITKQDAQYVLKTSIEARALLDSEDSVLQPRLAGLARTEAPARQLQPQLESDMWKPVGQAAVNSGEWKPPAVMAIAPRP